MNGMAVLVNQFSVILEEKEMPFFFSILLKNTRRVSTMALNSEVKMPTMSVVAKPRMAPLPKL